MTDVLVTGSTGYIGRNLLVRGAQAAPSLRFTGLARSLRNAEALGIPHARFVEGDVTQPDTMASAFAGVECVIHLAAAIAPRNRTAFARTNVEGTQHVVALARKAGVRSIVYVSTLDVNYARSTAYAASKRLAEEVVTASELSYVILRPTVVYGGHGTTPLSALEQIVRHSPFVPVIGSGAQRLQPLYIDDLIGVIVQALTAPQRSAIYEIGGPERFSQVALVRAIHDFLGKRWPTITVPIPSPLLTTALAPFVGFDRVRSFLERIAILNQDKIANNDPLLRDFTVAFTRLTDALRMTTR